MKILTGLILTFFCLVSMSYADDILQMIQVDLNLTDKQFDEVKNVLMQERDKRHAIMQAFYAHGAPDRAQVNSVLAKLEHQYEGQLSKVLTDGQMGQWRSRYAYEK